MPAYWFHYAISQSTNISFSYFFTEPISYYLSKTFIMFAFQAITNPIFSIMKAIKKQIPRSISLKERIILKGVKKL